MDCAQIDEQVVRPQDEELKELLAKFVCVRLTRMNDIDIGLFQFDYDLTWMCFFLDGGDRIYSRYGGRDEGPAEGRLSLAGLKHTMRQVLADHQQPAEFHAPRSPRPAHEIFTRARGCMHCHNVWEGLRDQARKDGTFDAASLWVYPLPEKLGLKLDVTRGNLVIEVTPQTPGAHAGLQAADELTQIEGMTIRSQADVMHALHLAPHEGTIRVHWRRAGQAQDALLDLTRGWKQTDLSWRASMRPPPKGLERTP